jgi:hypothetical protein
MGMDQKVTFALEKTPTWPALAGLLAGKNFPLQVRMIDGELAFPDETPPENWRELRVGAKGGMITLRRDSDGITLVTWGNADADTRQAWNALAWAVAHLTDGVIGNQSADDFRKTSELPDELR